MQHGKTLRRVSIARALVIGWTLTYIATRPLSAQPPEPSVVDRNLAVRTVISGFTTPIGAAFLGPNDMLVLEKNTGKVARQPQRRGHPFRT